MVFLSNLFTTPCVIQGKICDLRFHLKEYKKNVSARVRSSLLPLRDEMTEGKSVVMSLVVACGALKVASSAARVRQVLGLGMALLADVFLAVFTVSVSKGKGPAMLRLTYVPFPQRMTYVPLMSSHTVAAYNGIHKNVKEV